MDILKEFDKFLPGWAEKNLKPIPTPNSDNWNLAWASFTKEFLNPHWDEIAQDYKNMQYKTSNISIPITPIQNEIEPEEIEEEPEKSDWEKVQELLKKDQKGI